MPRNFSGADVEVMLTMAGLFGARTGQAGHNVAVISPDLVERAVDKDLVVIGSWDRQDLLQQWEDSLPFERRQNAIIVQAAEEVGSTTATVRSWFDRSAPADTVQMETTAMQAGLVSFRSPLSANRTVVAVMSSDDQGMRQVMNALTTPDLAARIQGDLVTVEGDAVTSYRVASTYEIGNLPFMIWARWYVSDKPIGMIVLVICAGLLLGFPIFTWLRSSAETKAKG